MKNAKKIAPANVYGIEKISLPAINSKISIAMSLNRQRKNALGYMDQSVGQKKAVSKIGTA